MHVQLIVLSILVNLIICRDFYVGMFKRNDYLVAQDRLYKERVPYRVVTAKYGRIFKCPITYFRIVDRLGVGRGPKVEILRGGLRKTYIVVRIMSVYNYPVSVNVYIGCENKMARIKAASTTTQVEEDVTTIGISVDVTPSILTNFAEDSSTKESVKEVKTVSDNSTTGNTTLANNTVTGNATK